MITLTLVKTTGSLLLLVQSLSMKLSLSPLLMNQVSGSHVHVWLVYVDCALSKDSLKLSI